MALYLERNVVLATGANVDRACVQRKPSRQEATEIVGALLNWGAKIDARLLRLMVEAEPSDERRKGLVMGLKIAGRITGEQCAAAISAYNLAGA